MEGSRVNLEKALTLSTRLGGHLVTGHVDGIGKVVERSDDARSVRFIIEAPTELARYIAHKGSICVDGTSLTVNGVEGARFDLNIVPHTLEETIMGDYVAGSRVNLGGGPHRPLSRAPHSRRRGCRIRCAARR